MVGLVSGIVSGLAVGLAAGLASAFVGGLIVGLLSRPMGRSGVGTGAAPGDLTAAASPRAVLARDRRIALLLMLAGGLAGDLAGGLVGGLVGSLGIGLVSGLMFGLVSGLGLSMIKTAWPAYILTKGRLASHHHLPWSLMSFLADAHRRGVLRQVGAVYQFRHLELQRRLATRP
jgi:hypothetical protein